MYCDVKDLRTLMHDDTKHDVQSFPTLSQYILLFQRVMLKMRWGAVPFIPEGHEMGGSSLHSRGS